MLIQILHTFITTTTQREIAIMRRRWRSITTMSQDIVDNGKTLEEHNYNVAKYHYSEFFKFLKSSW